MKNKIVAVSLAMFMLMSTVATAATALDRNAPAKLIVTGSAVNVRSGPATTFIKVAVVYKNQVIDCYGKIGTWYLIKTNNNSVGFVINTYVKANTATPTPTTPKPTPAPPTATAPPATTTGLTANEQEMFNLVNKERTSRGIAALKVDATLVKTARLKSQDMVNNNYFAHQSPTYGSPFDLMKKYGVTYRTAGENLAANNSVAAAHTALMNSPGHRENILNASYNYIGIGIVSSSKYGLMFTQHFIGR